MGAPLSVPRRLLSVKEYHTMIDARVFGEEDRIELIEGELIQMAPIGGPHMQVLNFLNHVLVPQLGNDGIVSPQNPIALLPDSEPEPDLVILRPECLHRTEVPSAKDVLLVIEISVSTLDYDRDVKIPLYAKHGIAEVWQFEPLTRDVSLFRDPTPNGYRTVIKPKRDETISPLLLPKVKVHLSELWP